MPQDIRRSALDNPILVTLTAWLPNCVTQRLR